MLTFNCPEAKFEWIGGSAGVRSLSAGLSAQALPSPTPGGVPPAPGCRSQAAHSDTYDGGRGGASTLFPCRTPCRRASCYWTRSKSCKAPQGHPRVSGAQQQLRGGKSGVRCRRLHMHLARMPAGKLNSCTDTRLHAPAGSRSRKRSPSPRPPNHWRKAASTPTGATSRS